MAAAATAAAGHGGMVLMATDAFTQLELVEIAPFGMVLHAGE